MMKNERKCLLLGKRIYLYIEVKQFRASFVMFLSDFYHSDQINSSSNELLVNEQKTFS